MTCKRCGALIKEKVFRSINIVFDGPPGHKPAMFIEVETDDGASIQVGEWIERPDGLWALRITELPN